MAPTSCTILAEPYAGLQAQALGLAEAAGLTATTVDLVPRSIYSWLAARLWPEPLAAVDLRDLPEGLCFTAGGTGGAVGAALRRRGNQVVQIQNPRMPARLFDVIVANAHDNISGPNVIITRTALNRVTPERLDAARAVWSERFAHLPRPLIAVLVGGSNGRFKLGQAEGVALARQLTGFVQRQQVGLMVTPSRRTPEVVRDTLRRAVEPLGGYVWDMQGENPYFGMLACADIIVPTIDSISMISEAAATSAPVLVAPLPGRSRRISAFVELLMKEGRVRQFLGALEFWPVRPLNDTQEAADATRRMLGF